MKEAFLGPEALQNQLFVLAALTELGGFGLVALGAHPGMFVGATFLAFGIAISKVALPLIGKIIVDRSAAMQSQGMHHTTLDQTQEIQGWRRVN